MFRQPVDPLGSPGLSALVAALPLLALLVLLAWLRLRSHVAAAIGLLLAIVLAVVFFRLPLGQALDGAVEGAAFGLFPIVWIIVNAVWINRLQRATRYFDVVGRTFSTLSADHRVQAVLVAYCFGAMIESLSGFGTPIAITAAMLLTLGLKPVRAAAVAVFANTAPAAFGSVGNPIQALSKVTSFPLADVGAMVGRQSAVIAALVPFVLLVMLDGRRGLREVWPVALTAGVAFGVGQYVCSNFLTYQLTDLTAAVLSMAAVVALLKVWHPVRVSASVGSGGGPAEPAPDSRRDKVLAFLPYAVLTVLFMLTSIAGPVQRFAAAAGFSFHWPGLNVGDASGHPLSITTFDLGWLNASGTVLLLTGVLTAVAFRLPIRVAAGCYRDALLQLRWAALAICCVLALSYVMNLSGMAVAIGTWLAGIGGAFALLSGVLGWFGVVLTGSDTSSNALFGALQVAAAHRVGISPLLMAATNSTGGVQGKAAAIQNLALAAGAVGMPGRESDILRRVLGWSLVLLAVLCLLAWLQTSVLSWMVL